MSALQSCSLILGNAFDADYAINFAPDGICAKLRRLDLTLLLDLPLLSHLSPDPFNAELEGSVMLIFLANLELAFFDLLLEHNELIVQSPFQMFVGLILVKFYHFCQISNE